MKKPLTPFARKLQKNQTPQEYRLWEILRARRFQGLKFRRQFPIDRYIVDFCCPEKKFILELDGGHHNQKDIIIQDRIRDRFFESQGYTVLRIWNSEVENNLSGVYEKIKFFIE